MLYWMIAKISKQFHYYFKLFCELQKQAAASMSLLQTKLTLLCSIIYSVTRTTLNSSAVRSETHLHPIHHPDFSFVLVCLVCLTSETSVLTSDLASRNRNLIFIFWQLNTVVHTGWAQTMSSVVISADLNKPGFST